MFVSLLLQLNETAWEGLVDDCDLFSSAPNCLSGGIADALTGKECTRPRQSQSWWALGSTAGKIPIQPHYDFDTGIVPNAGVDWRTIQGEGVSAHSSMAVMYLRMSKLSSASGALPVVVCNWRTQLCCLVLEMHHLLRDICFGSAGHFNQKHWSLSHPLFTGVILSHCEKDASYIVRNKYIPAFVGGTPEVPTVLDAQPVSAKVGRKSFDTVT